MYRLTRWNENSRDLFGLSGLQKEIDRMFDNFLSPSRMGTTTELASYSPACDVEENDSHFLLSFDMPGVSKDEVKIEITDNVLTVSGERKTEREETKNSRHLIERSYGSFRRSFTLPASVDAEKVEANYADGVLTISAPKSEAAKPRQIKISEGKPSFFRRLAGVTNESVKTNDKNQKAA